MKGYLQECYNCTKTPNYLYLQLNQPLPLRQVSSTQKPQLIAPKALGFSIQQFIQAPIQPPYTVFGRLQGKPGARLINEPSKPSSMVEHPKMKWAARRSKLEGFELPQDDSNGQILYELLLSDRASARIERSDGQSKRFLVPEILFQIPGKDGNRFPLLLKLYVNLN